MSALQKPCSGIPWPEFTKLMDSMKRDIEKTKAPIKKKTLARYRLLILLASSWGLRIGDLLAMSWQDADRDIIYLQEQKTRNVKRKKVRSISVGSKLRQEIAWSKNIIQGPDSIAQEDLPFDTIETKLIFDNGQGKPITVQAVNEKLKLIFRQYKMDVENASSHTLRKTFGKKVYDDAADKEAALIMLSEIFNHTSPAITRRYIGLTAGIIKDVYLNIWN